MLKKAGHKVTRLSGNPSLKNTIAYINKSFRSYDLMLEIHKNAGGGTGVEVLYYAGDAGAVRKAGRMCTKIAHVTGLRDRGAKPDTATRRERLGFVRAPGLNFIIELGFIDSRSDNAISHWRYAFAVAEAIRVSF
jgi:N-acetylmuramoyl-L-alanine amidase